MNSVNYQKTSKRRRVMPSVAGLGHVGMFTNDLFKMRDFYSRVMGRELTDEEPEG